MSEKLSGKKEKRRSSSSSSYSSTSSGSSEEEKTKSQDQPRPLNPLVNINKMKLDIGYKIQQEDLSDSDDSDVIPTPRSAEAKHDMVVKYSNDKDKYQDRLKSHERRSYRSRSSDKKRDRSHSRDSRSARSRSKDAKQVSSSKTLSKDNFKNFDKKERSKSREKRKDRSRSREKRKERSRSSEKRKERSRSRDRKKRRSKSRERKLSRSPKRDKKKDRSRSRERRREISKSKERAESKEKRRERTRSRERPKIKSRHDSRSPSYHKDRSHRFKRERSRDKSNKTRISRSRSRSRPYKRARSRSRSYDRSKRLHDKKLNKLCILEKLGIELKVPEGHMIGDTGTNSSGLSIPSYYNPAGVNPLKYAQQMQKRKLIWGNKKPEGEPSTEKKEEETVVSDKDNAGSESVWKNTTFTQDQDGKLTAKFKRLMGIKDAGEGGSSEKNSEIIQKQEEMFSSMEKQYEVARVSTHTHRGLGLGFGVHLPR